MIPSEHLTEALARAHEHWNKHHRYDLDRPRPFSIALSRESGTYGAAIAREVGNRLGWPVYDNELLQRIADDIGVHRTLVESVDERHENWLTECLAGFATEPHIDQNYYFARLMEIMLSLASHGNCIIVGRGATQALPAATTLRVRIVAPRQHRIDAVAREHNISLKDAAVRVDATDRDRNRFVSKHFTIDATNPANYDLVLNVARLSPAECADLIIAAYDRFHALALETDLAEPALA